MCDEEDRGPWAVGAGRVAWRHWFLGRKKICKDCRSKEEGQDRDDRNAVDGESKACSCKAPGFWLVSWSDD